MKNYTLPVLLFLFVIGISDALALRCGNRIIRIGDHKIDVLQKCGEPDYAETRLGVEGSRLRHNRGVLEIESYEQVVIDEWVYNFGPRKLKQFLLFENSVLKETRNLGYGD
ncbi:MAG: DUF2845 domain-containing protein [Methylicorpusculum sp.]|uniref:DUF2845 domain-containing protein n=1 Tax=Methylicorpusculum sp. TaxID=2713644 RepID=UPI00271C6350|nr:DUF2845 domain-containing protein [Methylicorpusculum sp.]MDO8937769.1 DUF2845 domain-containing protein [Methylicorpusculum sp.]MDP2200567.1 DUF2845 domain-containing protein [Methylicorpusculum sp.]